MITHLEAPAKAPKSKGTSPAEGPAPQPGAGTRVRRPDDRRQLLERLDLNRESHLVIEDGTLVPAGAMLAADAVVEIRSVISGGSHS